MELIARYWEQLTLAFDGLRKAGRITKPQNVAELVSGFLLNPTLRLLPPGHPLLTLLDVESVGAWRRLSPEERFLRFVRVCRDEEKRRIFDQRAARLLYRWAEDEACEQPSYERVSTVGELEESAVALGDQEGWDLEDPRWRDEFAYQELRLDVEQIVADAPPEQGKAGKLWLESIDQGRSFRDVCIQESEDPYRAKANLKRLLDRARQHLTS